MGVSKKGKRQINRKSNKSKRKYKSRRLKGGAESGADNEMRIRKQKLEDDIGTLTKEAFFLRNSTRDSDRKTALDKQKKINLYKWRLEEINVHIKVRELAGNLGKDNSRKSSRGGPSKQNVTTHPKSSNLGPQISRTSKPGPQISSTLPPKKSSQKSQSNIYDKYIKRLLDLEETNSINPTNENSILHQIRDLPKSEEINGTIFRQIIQLYIINLQDSKQDAYITNLREFMNSSEKIYKDIFSDDILIRAFIFPDKKIKANNNEDYLYYLKYNVNNPENGAQLGTKQSTNQSANQSAKQSANQSTKQSTKQSANQSTHNLFLAANEKIVVDIFKLFKTFKINGIDLEKIDEVKELKGKLKVDNIKKYGPDENKSILDIQRYVDKLLHDAETVSKINDLIAKMSYTNKTLEGIFKQIQTYKGTFDSVEVHGPVMKTDPGKTSLKNLKKRWEAELTTIKQFSPVSEPGGINKFISNLEYLITLKSKTIPGRWFYDINLNVTKDIVVPGNNCINKLIKSLSFMGMDDAKFLQLKDTIILPLLKKTARTPEEQTAIVTYLKTPLTSDACTKGGMSDISGLDALLPGTKQSSSPVPRTSVRAPVAPQALPA